MDSKTIKKINDFVALKPRTVQEIAQMLGKNWRTADSYVERIAKEQGTIAVRTFREGTKGALKIAYWQSTESIHSSHVQEILFKSIETGRNKEDFSAFDIYQYAKKKSVKHETSESEKDTDLKDFATRLRSCENQYLSFSGNMSFVNLKYKNKRIVDILKELADAGVTIRVLCRVDIPSIKNIERVMAINKELGRDAIEIRHCRQPIRGAIFDDRALRMKEILDPADYKPGELDIKTFLFYEIYDEEWVEWGQKVFWNLWRSSIPASMRIKELKGILPL